MHTGAKSPLILSKSGFVEWLLLIATKKILIATKKMSDSQALSANSKPLMTITMGMKMRIIDTDIPGSALANTPLFVALPEDGAIVIIGQSHLFPGL